MDGQDNLARCFVDIGDDVGDERTEESLTSAHCHPRRVPCRIEIIAQPGEVGRSLRRIGRLRRRQSHLARFDATERGLPALLELRGDQAIVGITGSVASLRQRGFVASLLELKFDDALLFAATFHVPVSSLDSRLDRYRLDRLEQLLCDRGVDTRATECEAPGQPQHQVGAIAAINRLTWRTARVAYHQAAATAATAQHPGEQSPSAASRLHSAQPAISIDGKLLLVPFEFRPLDVALMMVLEENLPLLERLAVAVALAGASFNYLGTLLAFAVGVGARVERVLEHRDDIAVADRRPLEAD